MSETTENREPTGKGPKTRRNRRRLPWWRRLIRSVTRIVVTSYLVTVVFMTSCQSRLVYHPSRSVKTTPRSVGMEYEDVRFSAEDGVDLHGWFVPARDSKGTVLFCHGNAGNIADRLYSVGTFHKLGFDVFIFDYRGYGLSDGKPSEEGTYLDAEAAWKHLTVDRNIDPERIVIFGRSLGGAVATHLARDHTPRRLIIESAFSSSADVAKAHFWYLPIRLIIRYDYDTVEYVKGVTCPVLVVHSSQDEIIPLDLGRKVYDAANEPKTFLLINGDHNNGFFISQSTYVRGLTEFLAPNEPKTFLEINGSHNNAAHVSNTTYVRGLTAFLAD